MTDMTGYDWINVMDIFDGYVSKLISKILKTYPYISYISFRILSYPFISSCSNTQMTLIEVCSSITLHYRGKAVKSTT